LGNERSRHMLQLLKIKMKADEWLKRFQ
jgi:hypothetical protein